MADAVPTDGRVTLTADVVLTDGVRLRPTWC